MQNCRTELLPENYFLYKDLIALKSVPEPSGLQQKGVLAMPLSVSMV